MKQLMIFAGALLLSFSAVKAQQDTTSNDLPVAPAQQTPQRQPTTPARQTDQYKQADRIQVQPDQVPSRMLETLRGKQFNGWENSVIYQDKIDGTYTLDIDNAAQLPKTYRFDKDGKLIDDPNRPGQNRDNDQ